MTDSSATEQQTDEALIINSTLVESVVILEEFYGARSRIEPSWLAGCLLS